MYYSWRSADLDNSFLHFLSDFRKFTWSSQPLSTQEVRVVFVADGDWEVPTQQASPPKDQAWPSAPTPWGVSHPVSSVGTPAPSSLSSERSEALAL